MTCAFVGSVMTAEAAEGTRSIVVSGFETGIVFEEENADMPRQVASLTKVATAVIVLKWIEEGHGKPSDLMTVSTTALKGGANQMGLQAGDQVAVETALYAAMMASDNASAAVLAEYVGERFPGGLESGDSFVEKMNGLAVGMGMNQTKFVNPHGLDSDGSLGVSTARDISLLAIHAISKNGFLKICSEKKKQVSFLRGNETVQVTLKNTNSLLGRDGVDGMKTGTTRRSGPCLIATATKTFPGDEPGDTHRIISVTLNVDDRFEKSAEFLEEGWKEYDRWLKMGRPEEGRQHLRKAKK